MNLNNYEVLRHYTKAIDNRNVMRLLGRLLAHYSPKFDHSYRVGLMSMDVATELKMGWELQYISGLAGVLHDIGQVDTPVDILEKPDKLSEVEIDLVREHASRGYEIVMQDREIDERIGAVIVAHHEFQQSPYPRGRVDRRINAREAGDGRRDLEPDLYRVAQIVAVSDLCDALASERSYKPALPKSRISELLQSEFTGERRLIELALNRVG